MIIFVGLIGVVALVVAGWFILGARNKNLTSADASRPTQDGQPAKQTNKPTPPTGMVYVPGGEFMVGRDNGDEYERPAHRVTVQPFFLDINEVTNEDYAEFIKASDHSPPTTWKSGSYAADDAHKPVTGVTWYDAGNYAKWRSKRDGARYRLPTEEEWEFAARGTDGRIYPWGNAWKPGLANADGASVSIAETGAYKGTSPFGAFDMVGNVWEWTASRMKAYTGGRVSEQPQNDTMVVRGGNYKSNQDQATTTYRLGLLRTRDASRYTTTGFRCVKDLTGTQAP